MKLPFRCGIVALLALCVLSAPANADERDVLLALERIRTCVEAKCKHDEASWLIGAARAELSKLKSSQDKNEAFYSMARRCFKEYETGIDRYRRAQKQIGAVNWSQLNNTWKKAGKHLDKLYKVLD